MSTTFQVSFHIRDFSFRCACKMLLKQFYIEVVSSEEKCVKFLQDNLLLGDSDSAEPWRWPREEEKRDMVNGRLCSGVQKEDAKLLDLLELGMLSFLIPI